MIEGIIVISLIGVFVAVTLVKARKKKTLVMREKDLPQARLEAARLRGLELCECGAARDSKVHNSLARWPDYHTFVPVNTDAG